MADPNRRSDAEAERQRISAIAHTGSPMWGPIGSETITELTALVGRHGINGASRVLDLGCGPAELLRRVCESTGARGTGIDASPFAIAEARRRLAGSPARDRIELHLGDATTLDPRGDQDLVICIGPGWKSGGWRSLATWASRFSEPGGLLLLGEGAWRADPPRDAIARLGIAVEDYPSSDGVADAVAASGARVIWRRLATTEEWSAYAGDYRAAMRSFAREHADDPVRPGLLERAESGWADYETLHELLDFVIVLAVT